ATLRAPVRGSPKSTGAGGGYPRLQTRAGEDRLPNRCRVGNDPLNSRIRTRRSAGRSMYLKSSELQPATVVKLSRESAILGRRCHGLSLNESPFPPLPGVLSAAEKAIRLLNRYPDPTCGALIAELTARLGLPE